MKGRNSQVSRVYRVLSILESVPQGLSVAELATRLKDRGFDVGKRTIYRDLEALKASGFPLEESGKSDDQGARWRLERQAKAHHHLALSSRELLGLYMARSVFSPLKETPFYEDLVTSFQKIEEKLGQKAHGFLQELEQDVQFEPGPRWGLGIDADVMETVRSACNERQMLRIQYSSVNSGQTSWREVGPHYLYFAKGSFYLVAEDIMVKTVKTFAVPRIKASTMLEQPYQGDITSPGEFFQSSFGVFRGSDPIQIKVRFGQKIASYIKERRWHDSQSVTEVDNGSIEVSMKLSVTPELVQWILGFGAQAKVLEPIDLVREIQKHAREILEQY